ncbi:MAG: tetratricopeptide repeat protein [Helicobacter sp.]|nr:tetratricopeptide repeat protein [Helicobacter sp.]
MPSLSATSLLSTTTTVTFADNAAAQQNFAAGNYKQALVEYNKLIASNPVATNYLGLAMTYKKLNHTIHAINALQEAMRIDPQNIEAQAMLVQTYMGMHNFAAAKAIVEPLYETHKDNVNIAALYMNYLIGVGDYKTGRTLLDFLLENSSHAGILNNAGLIEIELGNMTKAIEYFRRGFRTIIANPLPKAAPKLQDFMDPETGKKGLLAIKRTLDELGVPFLLVAGTILGIYRDGDLLPHDKDVDLGLPWGIPRAELIHTVCKYNFACNYTEEDINGEKGQWNISIVHIPTGTTIDFFFLKPEGDTIVGGIHKNGKTLYTKTTNTGRMQLDYAGTTFWTFGKLDSYLGELYGAGWRTPQANYNTLILSETVDDPDGVGISLCYNHCLGALCEAYYKKGHGYAMQLLSVHDDPLLLEVKEYLEKNLNEEWYPPIPPRQKRSNNKDLFGIQD